MVEEDSGVELPLTANHSSDWIEVGKNNEGMTYFYNRGMVRNEETNTLQLLVKILYSAESSQRFIRKNRDNGYLLEEKFNIFSYFIHMVELDCEDKKYRTIYRTLNDIDDIELLSHLSGSRVWTDIKDDHLYGEVMKVVCKSINE